MIRVDMRDIPPGSHEVRVWINGGWGDPITTVCVLRKESQSECEISMMHGRITRRMLIMIAQEAVKLGYSTIRFSLRSGSRPPKFATLVDSDGALDHYRVDLGVAVQG